MTGTDRTQHTNDNEQLHSEHVSKKIHNSSQRQEHILVCLSSSPSNAKIIRSAANMAEAFDGSFTALFVETPGYASISSENKLRLQNNTRLARQLGASIETVFGEDISFQIAEYARLSGITKIVIGRSADMKRGLLPKTSLTDQLLYYAPNIDIHIIPDSELLSEGIKETPSLPLSIFKIYPVDMVKTVGILFAATLLGILFDRIGLTAANIMTLYILSILVISIVTYGYSTNIIASLMAVFVFNFFFTEPRYSLLAYDADYPVTFLVMFIASFITGNLAIRLKNAARLSARAAYRTKILFDTAQLISTVHGTEAIMRTTANQLGKLLNQPVVIYPVTDNRLQEPMCFMPEKERTGKAAENEIRMTDSSERAAAHWVWVNNHQAGAGTEHFSQAICRYYAIRMGSSVYGVVGIALGGRDPEAFEASILLSILGECALALENEKNAREKEAANLQAQNEQLRANLVRAISHDLRTPLTTIAGNASNLLSNSHEFDEDTRKQLYTDIYDDAMWLNNLVENLLAISRIEEGSMQLHMTSELLDEVVTEALQHIDRNIARHHLITRFDDELLLVRMDSRLIMQVIINLVNNAVKYTQEGSDIELRMWKKDGQACISVADNGPGISREDQVHIFEMFYTGHHEVIDSHRSLGLGLSLCKSIAQAHGGDVKLTDNQPSGCIFTLSLPAEDIKLNDASSTVFF